MDLNDLLTLPNSQLTDDELELKISVLRKLRIVQEEELDTEDDASSTRRIAKKPKVKSNKEQQMESLLNSLSPEEKAKFDELLAKARRGNG